MEAIRLTPYASSSLQLTLFQDILKLIKQISGEQDLKHAIDGVIEGATFLLHADRVSLFFVDHVQKSLIIGISKGSLSRDVSKLASIRIPLNNSSIAGHVALVSCFKLLMCAVCPKCSV